MPKEIVLLPRTKLPPDELDRRARLLLSTQTDAGDDDVLDRAIKIARDEKLDVVFRSGDKLFTPAVAYSLRYDRGIDVRHYAGGG